MPRKTKPKNVYAQRLIAWAEALESGEYNQCIARLSIPGKRKDKCPLGVACHLSKVGDWKKGVYWCSPTDKEERQLPKAVMEYYGLTDPMGAEIMRLGAPVLASFWPTLASFNDFMHPMNESAEIIRNYAAKIERLNP